MTVAPYGSWPSPITSDFLVERMVSLSEVLAEGGALWWSEGRPSEGGRQVIVRDGADVLPAGFSARTRVHEYGGGAYTVHRGTLFFANLSDQRLYRLDPGASAPVPLTADDGISRFADLTVSPDGRWVTAVRERHGAEVDNDVVALPADPAGRPPLAIAAGHDFFAAPRWSPDGRRLAWLAWDHPNMPWDGTQLWVADVDLGVPSPVRRARLVAGGPEESISQPRWSPAGVLHWISDQSGWWNLYREGTGGQAEALAPLAAEFAGPDWVFGESSYTFLADGRLVATWSERGFARLGTVAGGEVAPVPTPFTSLSSLRAVGTGGDEVVAIAASASQAPAVVAIDIGSGAVRVVRSSRAATAPAGAVSTPRPLSYPTTGDRTAYALYYPPYLEGFEAPAGELPPLLVRSHGGPTSAASSALNLEIQFWTSRGFAVVDVDYAGSTGYGRTYRRRLDGGWGIADVDDCVAAARHLATQGEIDGRRMVVRGRSAGGYTTLCALAFRDVFAAGASYFGVADLEGLARDTHKFESRYLDRLVGPYPERRDLYIERSPLHAADGVTAPVILFQGLEDAVVPPAQAEVFVRALRANGVPYAYLAFEGEQHGFRRAETIRRSIEAELWFFGRVLGFEPAGDLEPVALEYADRLVPGSVEQNRSSKTM